MSKGKLAWKPKTVLPPALPARIGPVEFSDLDGMVAIRCPQDFVPILQWAGGVREPGSHRWLVERRRVGPSLRRATGMAPDARLAPVSDRYLPKKMAAG